MGGWKMLEGFIIGGLDIFENLINGGLRIILKCNALLHLTLDALVVVSLAGRFQLKWARCTLINIMDFHCWFTFGANYKFTSSKFWKSDKWGGGGKISKISNQGDDYSVQLLSNARMPVHIC